MYIYFGMIVLIAIIAIITRKRDKYFWIISGMLITFIIGCRNPSVGTDTRNYMSMYTLKTEYYINYFLSGAPLLNIVMNDPLYFLYSYVLANLGVSEQLFIFITAAITVFLLFLFMSRYSEQPFLCILTFITVGFFPLIMSACRQGLSIAIASLCFNYVLEKKPIKYVVTILIASGFHISAIVLLPLYLVFLFFEKRKPEHIFVTSMILGFAFSGLFFGLISVTNLGPRFSVYLESSTIKLNPLVLIMYMAIIVICMFIDRNWTNTIDESKQLFYVSYGIGIIILIFSLNNNMISRFSYYFFVPLPLLLGNSINRIEEERDRGLTIMVALFVELSYFIYDNIDSVLNISNYTFFWQ